MADAGALFNQGFANGLQARRQKEARKQQEFENQLRLRDADLAEAMDRKKMEQMEKEWAIKQEELKSNAARFVESEKALEMFNAATSVIDFGSPAAAEQYQRVTLQYLPTILKHEGATKKWQTFDAQVKQGQAFTLEKAREAGVVGAYRQAVELGIVDFPRNARGELDTDALQVKIDEALDRKFERDAKLRRASVDARMEAEASGAYGGRTATKPTMGPGTKAELDAVADELRSVNKALVEPKLTPERKLDLVNRKSALQRRLRSFDAMAAPQAEAPDPEGLKGSGPEAPKAPDAPGKEGQSRSIKVGNTVWQLNIRE